ncbi:MAG: PKD domain-containing protein, partial [Dysgonamonadaceae bacterium]|nr:PKD domain-containing protein [Dysgonamonadaceae bacterium]
MKQLLNVYAKKVLLLFVMFWLSATTYAAYLTNYPIEVKQPDGTIVQLYTTGDEYHSRVHDAEGYTIIRDPQTGYLVYAILKNDDLVSSGYLVGKASPKNVGLVPNLDLSAAKRTQIRQTFLANTPAKTGLRNAAAPTAGLRAGTLNNIVVYIRFSDETGFTSSKNAIETLFTDETPGASLYSYFRDISNNTFTIPSTFYPQTGGTTVVSYQDSHPRAYYQPYDATSNTVGYGSAEETAREHTLLKNAVEFVKTEIEPLFTGSELDYDNNGYVDNICFVVKGAPGAWSSLLWPHRFVLYTNTTYLNGKRVWDYNFILEEHLFTASNGRQSVLVHETYHTLSAPDLYMYNGANTSLPVSSWDVMCSNTVPPQSSTAYISQKYGNFIGDIPAITTSGTYTLYDIWDRTNGHNIAYKIASPNSLTEYFILEYRRKTGGKVYESAIPGEGIIIYRVNPSIFDGNASSDGTAAHPYELYVFRPGASNNSAAGSVNTAFFSSQSGRTTFSDTSNPPCFLSDNSPGLGGIVIDQISSSGGETMTFRVTFPTAGVPVATDATAIVRTGFSANWNPSTGATNYLLSVYYKEGTEKKYTDGGFLDQSVGNVITCPVTGLDRNIATKWFYTVKAVSGGVPSEPSNEIEVNLAEFDPISCDYESNMSPGETIAGYTAGGAPIAGHAYNCTQYAEYYLLPNVKKVAGFKMNVQALQNKSGDSEYAKITMKLWNVDENGEPGTVLYSEDFAFSALQTGENILNFASPITTPAEFFIGYEIYYHPSITDVFGVYPTNPRGEGGKNTMYCYQYGTWFAMPNFYYLYFTTSLFLFPEACTFVPIPDFTAQQTAQTMDVSFTNQSVASSETTWLWEFSDESTSTEENPTHTYTSSGNFSVKLTATNTVGRAIQTKEVTVTPTVIHWMGASSTDWNTPANYSESIAPNANIDVRILASATRLPILTGNKSDNVCKNIYFEPGAEIGRQDLLTYDKAFVQLDFSASGLERNRWYMLSSPLQELYVGDFSFSGFPGMDVNLFQPDPVQNNKAVWKRPSGLTHSFAAGDGFLLWLASDPEGQGTKGLIKSGGIIELPYFDNPNVPAEVHWTHEYAPSVSTFGGWKDEGGSISRTTASVTVDRDLSQAYRLAEGTVNKPLSFGSDHFAIAGNPYMSSIDFAKLQTENSPVIKDTYYIWIGAGGNSTTYTPGSYAVYNAGIDETAGPPAIELTQNIAPMQSFIVEKYESSFPVISSDDPSSETFLTFDLEKIGVTDGSAGLRSAAVQGDKLAIVASTAQAGIRTVIASRQTGNNSFGSADSRKLFNEINSIPEVYTLKPGTNNAQVATAVNVLGEITGETLIPLVISTTHKGELTFTFSGMDTYNARIYLLDTETNTETELTGKAQYEYRFDYVPAQSGEKILPNESRFFIRLNK